MAYRKAIADAKYYVPYDEAKCTDVGGKKSRYMVSLSKYVT